MLLLTMSEIVSFWCIIIMFIIDVIFIIMIVIISIIIIFILFYNCKDILFAFGVLFNFFSAVFKQIV